MARAAPPNGRTKPVEIETPRDAARIGEIVQASTTRLRAVAAETFAPPPFGSFVKAEGPSRTTYAVVAHVEHASIDPARRAIPLGRTWDELSREQPQVLELLTTEFEAICVAFAEAGAIMPFLPPGPPRVHEFVSPCDTAEVRALTDDLSFIRTLATSATSAPAELVAAAVRAATAAREGDDRFLIAAGREIADVYRQDYDQATAVLRRLGR